MMAERDGTTLFPAAWEAGMTPGVIDIGMSSRAGLLDRIAVRSDIANWRMPLPWPIALGIASAIMAWLVATAFGNLVLTAMLLALSLVLLAWLAAPMIRRAWCEYHPYLPPRWLADARATLGNDLIDAALDRVRDTT